jgi:hypothetical protein
MTSDFMPIPEMGAEYTKQNGDIIKVTNFYQNNGGVPDYVEYIELSKNITCEALADDWNNMNLQIVSPSQSIPEPDSQEKKQKDSPTDSKQEEENKPIQHPQSANDTSTKGVIDEKLDKLSRFLNDEPFTKMPFNIPSTIINFETTEDIPENEIKEDDVIKEIDEQIQAIRAIREEGRKRKSSFLNEFLWSCAGVDKPLLRMSSQDYAKKAGMGGTILFTALMAMISGGYAIYTVFQEATIAKYAWIIGIIFGIFWGCLIFNLDRYMVSSMYTDGKPSISKKEFLSGLPRIVIAILLGIVISTPLELVIFSGKINAHIQEQVLKASNEIMSDTTMQKNLQYVNEKIKICKDNLDDAKKEEQDALVAFTVEVNKGDQGRIAGYGPNAKKKEAIFNDAKNKRETYEEQLNGLYQERDSIIQVAKINESNKVELDKGLATRIAALHSVTIPGSGLCLARYLIMVLFICLEVLPVLNKMMMSSGKYDDWLDQESDLVSRKIRCEEYNLFNVVRSGKLGSYANEIMGSFSIEKHMEDIVGTNIDIIESTIDLEKHNFAKENKLRIEKENQETVLLITSEVSKYLQNKILNMLRGSDTTKVHMSQSSDKKDASDDAIKIV